MYIWSLNEISEPVLEFEFASLIKDVAVELENKLETVVLTDKLLFIKILPIVLVITLVFVATTFVVVEFVINTLLKELLDETKDDVFKVFPINALFATANPPASVRAPPDVELKESVLDCTVMPPNDNNAPDVKLLEGSVAVSVR